MLWWGSLALAVPVEIEVGTQLPLDVGVGVRADLGSRLVTSARLGLLPGGYVDAINAFAMASGAYGEPTADVIRSSIGWSVAASAEVGVRPFTGPRTRVFAVQAGYTLVALGGQATAAEIVSAAFGVVPPITVSTSPAYDLSATVHLLRPEIIATPRLGEHLGLVVGVGGAFTVAAKARVEPAFEPLFAALHEAYASEAEDWLAQTLRRHVHTPTARLGLAYRF